VSWLDVEFHTIVMEASNRRRLIATWRSIHSQLLLWLSTMHRAHAESAKVRDITLAAHRRLVRIMAGGDAKQARAEAVKHLSDWRPVIAGMAHARPKKGASR
jgi:DNA-binding GntR family transcriptional regulator